MINYYKKLLAGALMLMGVFSLQAQTLGTDCFTAIPISDGIYEAGPLLEGNGATNLCFQSGGTNAAWYAYTPTMDGLVTITSDVEGETPDTRLSVYEGSCDNLSCIGFDDDGGEVFSSFLQVPAVAGETIYVEWDDRWNAEAFSFFIGTVEAVIPGCTDSEAYNYNPEATIDDGSCFYEVDCDNEILTVFVSGGTFNLEVSWSITDNNGNTLGYGEIDDTVAQLCLEDGCYSLNMFDSFGDGWNGAVAVLALGDVIIAETTLEGGSIGNFTFGINTELCEEIVLEIPGCTDPEALNFDQSATVDDDSCIYPFSCDNGIPAQFYLCTFDNGSQVDVSVVGDDGTVVFEQNGFNNIEVMYQEICLQEGVCYSVTMNNNEGPFGWYGGYYWISLNGITISTGSLEEGLASDELIFSLDGTCGEIFGCTDPEANNYNPEATADNGLCEYTIDNDDCGSAIALSEGIISINNIGATSEGLYGDCWGFGNGEPEQNGIWYSFVTPQEPAAIIIEAIGDGTYTLTDTQFGLFSECGGDMIFCDGNSGEGLLSKFEFECGSLEPNTEYRLLIDGWAGNQGTCLLSYQVAVGCETILGCTDVNALNYNPEATVDDGSCLYSSECELNEVVVSFELGSWPGEVSWYIVSQFGDAVIYAEGGTNNGEPQVVCLPDDCFQVVMNDTWGDGWNGNIMTITYNQEVVLVTTLEDGEYGVDQFGINTDDCESLPAGCTDPEAINYDPEAVINDGSCEYEGSCDLNEGSLFIYSDPNGSEAGWAIVDLNGELYYAGDLLTDPQSNIDLCLPDGCFQLCVWGAFGPESGFAEFWVGDEGHFFEFSTQECYSFAVNAECEGVELFGCTDPEAFNYNPLATIDDGSCIYDPLPGDCLASFEIISVDENEDVVWILNTSTFGWGIEYLWDFGDGNTSTAPLPIHTYTEDGTYEICLTITGPNECEDTYCMAITYEGPGAPNGEGGDLGSNSGFSINVVDGIVNGIEDNVESIANIQLYPNPASSTLNVQFNLKDQKEVQINVLDVTGALVQSLGSQGQSGVVLKSIDVANLNAGMYFLEFRLDGNRVTKKFSVIR